MKTIITDVLVIGAGAAAGIAAIEATASKVQVDLVDKGRFGESGSSPACLVGLAGTLNREDSPGRFFEDWVRAGGRISDQNLVWEAINQSSRAVEKLEAIGIKFLQKPDGSRFFYRGAGHTVARGQTVKFDGAQQTNVVGVLRAEAEKQGIRVHEGIMVTKLIQKDRRVIGAMGLSREREFYVFSAKAVVLAAGGANRLYPNIPPDIVEPKYRTTGDGFCLAFAAGAPLIDMEFTQFRESPPRAARYGGRYLNALGERFMEKYDPDALERAPRHRLVGAVYQEMKAGRGPIVWEPEEMREVQGAERQLVNITIDFQRVLGGVQINERAETSVPGLFAAGESSGGVHGSDRMQGNAFLETQVFGANAGRNAAVLALNAVRGDITPQELNEEEARIASISGDVDAAEVTTTIQKTMWEQVGIIRNRLDLQDAMAKFERLRKEIVPRLSADNIFFALEAENLLLSAEMVTRAALTREETRGTQIRADCPVADDHDWLKHVCITSRSGEIAISSMPVVTRAP